MINETKCPQNKKTYLTSLRESFRKFTRLLSVFVGSLPGGCGYGNWKQQRECTKYFSEVMLHQIHQGCVYFFWNNPMSCFSFLHYTQVLLACSRLSVVGEKRESSPPFVICPQLPRAWKLCWINITNIAILLNITFI